MLFRVFYGFVALGLSGVFLVSYVRFQSSVVLVLRLQVLGLKGVGLVG